MSGPQSGPRAHRNEEYTDCTLFSRGQVVGRQNRGICRGCEELGFQQVRRLDEGYEAEFTQIRKLDSTRLTEYYILDV